MTIGEDTVLAGQVGHRGQHPASAAASCSPARSASPATSTSATASIATAQTGHPARRRAPGAFVSGYPAIDNRAWLKSSAVFAKLPELQKRVRELERGQLALG